MATSTRLAIRTAEGTRRESFGAAEWGLVAFLGLTWGASFLFIDIALDSLAPGVITWLRIVLGAGALALMPQARGPVERQSSPQIVLLGVTWIAIPFTLFPIAQQWIDSSLAGILNAALPLFAAAIAAVLLRRLPRRIHIAGLILGFIGVVLVILPSWGEGDSAPLGIMLVLLATLFYGFSVNIAVPLQQAYGALPVILRAQTIAGVATLPYAIIGLPDSSIEPAGLGAVFILGVFGTGIALAVMASLVGRVGATRGGVAIYFIPVVAVILGVVFRNETIAPLAIGGMVVVLIGAYLTSRREAEVSGRGPGAAPRPGRALRR
jgi:drug/metabolite transporter (DMT)-like permease